MNLSVSPKLMGKFNAISIKIPKRDFKKLNRWIIKFTWNKKNAKIARKAMGKKKKNENRLTSLTRY